MFNSISEKVIVGVLTALLLGMIYWVWDQVRSVRIGLPAGVIVFSEKSCADLGNFQNFEEASGRFIVVTGRGQDLAGSAQSFFPSDTGGDYTTKLTIDNIPAHGHSIATGYGIDWHDGLAGSPSAVGIFPDFYNRYPGAKQDGGHGEVPNAISRTGGDAAFSNLPPYFALNACISL